MDNERGSYISRRSFLKGASIAAATMATVPAAAFASEGSGSASGSAAASGSASAASSAAASGSAASSGSASGSAAASGSTAASGSAAVDAYVPSFMTPPAVPADVAQTLSCDVLVIGVGLAGVAAVRAAAEAGASVIGVEKQADIGVVTMAGDFGVYGSQIQKDLGIPLTPKAAVVNQLMKDMCYRPTPDLLNYWYDHSGEDFDWFIANADYEVLTSTAADQQTDKPNYIRPKCFPALPGYDYRTEYYPYFHGTLTTNPNMAWACESTRDTALGLGVQLIFNTWGEQLIKDGDAVVGAYVRDVDGNYTRIDAKTVILSCGDFGSNLEMRHYYVPWADEFACIYGFCSNPDAAGGACDVGEGHQMGMWAGAQMELGPLAPMTHHMGGALGVDSYLQLNLEGKRFMNEDIPGQNIADQLSRQPGKQSWQIFDSKWPEQLGLMGTGHGYVNYYIPDDEVSKYSTVLAGFGLGYTTSQMVEDTVTCKADTIEELAEAMSLPVDTVVEQVARYNDLCHAGYDADYGKVGTRMFPVENPPYYACNFGSAGMLVCMGGLRCNNDLQALDAAENPIPGLYVAGNNMGGRFLVEYPVTQAGISCSTALTFGRLAGTNAAAAALA